MDSGDRDGGAIDPYDDPRVGSLMGGKWRLDYLIGIGGMASVYAASHRNGAVAAIKVLHAHYARSREARERFLREPYIANKAGPGAVRVLDDDVDDDGSPYLVMELLSGEPVDLRADRNGGTLPVADVLFIARETLATLEIAHANGIIHRDLKPANLFWTEDDTLKMLDFGIARLHTSNRERTMAGLVVGTPGYMAPEQALGVASEIDARTDVWSVGAIMFNLLTGRDVHPADGGNEIVTSGTRHAPKIHEIDPAVPEDVAKIVDRALRFERGDRYPSARSMRNDVVRISGEAAIAPSAGPPRSGGTGHTSRARVSVEAALEAAASVAPTEFEPPPDSLASSDPTPGLATGMSDDDTHALRGLFELMDVALLSRAELQERGEERWLTAARLGTFRKLEMAHGHAVKALASAHIGLFWNVLPEGFATKQGLLWTAKPPLPPTPATMFDGGVRMLGLLPGLELEEFGEVMRLVGGDLAPFSNYATFLQSSQLPHLVYRIDPTKPGMPEHPSISIDSTTSSGGVDVSALLGALVASDPALRAALFHRLERIGHGHEPAMGDLLKTSPEEVALGLVRVLVAIGSEAARAALMLGADSPHRLVRIDALAILDSKGPRLRSELRELLDAPEPATRIAALVALERYKIKAAVPAVAALVKSASFDLLSAEERRQALATIGALAPMRAESIAIGLVQDQRVITSEPHEITRELACEALGHVGRSSQAREALEGAAKGHWRASERVQAAAGVAALALVARTNPLS